MEKINGYPTLGLLEKTVVKSVLLTASGARLQLKYSSQEALNWLFLPGGPGLGSESVLPLVEILKLPGNIWLLDLPGDGSNITSNNLASFSKWPQALIEAAGQFDQVILVAHSTGGMYTLFLPELESLLKGLVLLDSAPDASWQTAFAENIKNFSIPGLDVLQQRYEKHPSNQTLKELTIASAPYLFTQQGQAYGKETLRLLPYNYEACGWSQQYFDQTYQAQWVPKTLPTLILAGAEDLITPLKLFQQDKRFSRENIIFKSIPGAGHFPWIENPQEVAMAFSRYARQFRE